MNNQVFRSVDTAREDDDCTHIVDELDLSELGSMSLDSYGEDIELLKMKIEVQKEIIDDLASSMCEMEVGYKVKIAMKDDELNSLREQCENYRRIIRESLNDNSPPRDAEQLFDPSQSTPEVDIETEETVGRTDDVGSGLVVGLKNCPAAASLENFHKVPSTIGDEPTDSCLATSARLDEKSAIADLIVLSQVTAERIDETRVDSVEEKSCEVIPVLMAHDHKCTGTVNATAVNDINENRTEKKVDGQKEFNPMSALEELCVHRNWTLPKYEYFEVDSSEPFYTVECTVMSCTVKAGGRSKEEAERKVAAMLYNTVKHSSRKSAVPLETKSEKYSSAENKPVDALNGDVASTEGNQVPIELVGPRDLKNVNEHQHIGTPMSYITKQCTEDIKPEEPLKSDPIRALQNLCVSRNWRIPTYVFFEEGRSNFFYSAECTVMTCTVRVEGLFKKDAKRQAAKVMYEKVKNFTCYGDFPTANHSGKSTACTSSDGNCQKPTNELTGRSEENPVEHERVGTVVTALNCNYTKIDHPEKDMDTKLRFHPTCVLQELCTSRKWPMPGYEYFENKSHLGARTYTVKCTVLAWSVKAEGLSKKAAKRQAATMMYHTIENGEKVGFGKTTMDRGQ